MAAKQPVGLRQAEPVPEVAAKVEIKREVMESAVTMAFQAAFANDLAKANEGGATKNQDLKITIDPRPGKVHIGCERADGILSDDEQRAVQTAILTRGQSINRDRMGAGKEVMTKDEYHAFVIDRYPVEASPYLVKRMDDETLKANHNFLVEHPRTNLALLTVGSGGRLMFVDAHEASLIEAHESWMSMP